MIKDKDDWWMVGIAIGGILFISSIMIWSGYSREATAVVAAGMAVGIPIHWHVLKIRSEIRAAGQGRA